MQPIILYSNGCARCQSLKKRLEDEKIPYEECNSVEKMLSLGFTKVPVLQAFGESVECTDPDAWKKMKERALLHEKQQKSR